MAAATLCLRCRWVQVASSCKKRNALWGHGCWVAKQCRVQVAAKNEAAWHETQAPCAGIAMERQGKI